MNKRKHHRLGGDQHVVRRCGYQVIERDAYSKQVVGLFPSAMGLRTEINEVYLSVNWLEHCPGTKVDRLKTIVAIHRAKARSQLSQHSGVSVLKTERLLKIGSEHNRQFGVRCTPSKIDPSYSRISGLPSDNSDESLLSSLAAEAYEDFILLADLDAL